MIIFKEIEKKFILIEKSLSKKDLKDFMDSDFTKLFLYHFGLGTFIRNEYLMPGMPLFKLFCKCGINSPDDMSSVMIKLFYIYENEKHHDQIDLQDLLLQ